MKTFKRTPLSSVFLFSAIVFLAGWAASMLLTAFVAIDLAFKLNRGSTPRMLLLGLLVTFAFYVAYLISSFMSRVVKYPRAQQGPTSIV